MLHKYVIENGEQFNGDNCPKVMSELNALQEGMALLPRINKDDIIISFLKNHSISNEWIESNPEVAKEMSTSSFAVSELEAYFEGCKDNKSFLTDFEKMIRTTFQGAKAEA